MPCCVIFRHPWIWSNNHKLPTWKTRLIRGSPIHSTVHLRSFRMMSVWLWLYDYSWPSWIHASQCRDALTHHASRRRAWRAWTLSRRGMRNSMQRIHTSNGCSEKHKSCHSCLDAKMVPWHEGWHQWYHKSRIEMFIDLLPWGLVPGTQSNHTLSH